jgi:hemoglobin-like flavoprotein
MTPRQVELVQDSWKQIQQNPDIGVDDVASLFYERLFALDPGLRVMFRADLKEQGRKLMAMIGFAVNGLHRLDAIVPGLHALGRRHAGYGVQDSHYATVAIALLWTLGQGLGEKFNDEMRSAWAAAYRALSNTMREAAEAPA